MDSIILIPAYKPDENLLELTDRLLKSDVRFILVVNDGSGAEFDHIFQTVNAKDRVTVIEHDINRGKGAALRTGFSYILAHHPGCQGVVTVDADGQHLPADVEKIRIKLAQEPESLVMGVRKFAGKIPFRSILGNRATQFLFRTMVGRHITDTQTGLRGIPLNLLPSLVALKSDRYAFELEMLLDLCQKDSRITEVPITTVYEDNNQCSHFNPLLDSFLVYRVLFRWWFRFRLFHLIKYSMSGLLSTAADFGGYALLISLSFGIASASIAARVLAVLCHFMANKYFTYAHRDKPKASEVVKYLAIVLLNLSMSIVLIHLLVKYFALGEIIAKVIAQLLLFWATYALLTGFVFHKKRE